MRKSSLIFIFVLIGFGQAFGQVPNSSSATSPSPRPTPENNLPESESSEKTVGEAQFNYNYDSLSNGYGDWHSASLDFSYRFKKRRVLYGAFRKTERFGQRDNEGTLGFYQPLSRKWALLLEANASPTHRTLPKWSALVQVERGFKRGWNLQTGYRRTNFNTAKVNVGIIGVEKYFGNYRAAYTLSVANLEAVGTSASHRVQFNRYYGEQVSAIGFSGGFGRELESLGRRGVLQTDVLSGGVSGRHWFTRRWGINYDFSLTRQGKFYVRRSLNIGVRFKF